MEAFIVPLILLKYAMETRAHTDESETKKVFIVEDNDMHTLMMDYMLSQETPAHISKFSSGEACLQNLEKNPDVVILDYGLPGINGIQTLLEIKKRNPDIPVIVVTSNKDLVIAKKFLDAGVYDYIEKDEDAFNQVSKITDSILSIMARKKAKDKQKKERLINWGITAAIVVAVIIAIIIHSH